MTMRTSLALGLGMLPLLTIASCCPCRFGDGTNTAANAVTDSTGDAPKVVPYAWKPVITLGGGFTTGLNYSVVEKDLLYCRTDIGGAYRWNAKDSTWIPITDGFGPKQSNYLGVESLIPDPKDANRVYGAFGTYTASWGTVGAIGRSSDRGDTWEITEMPIKMGGNEYGRSAGERLAVDPNDTNLIYFGSRRDGLWKSTDRGVTWAEVKSFPAKDPENGFGSLFVTIDGKTGSDGKASTHIYVAFASLTKPNLYRSKDSGSTWEPVPGAPKGVMLHHGDFDKDGNLYLCGGNNPGPGELTDGGVWKYEPKTEKWTDITPLKPTAEDKFGYGGLSANPNKAGVLMVTTLDRWSRGDEIFRTEDGGKTWKAIKSKSVLDDAGAKYLYWGRNEKPSNAGWMGEIAVNPFNDDEAMHVTGQGNWLTKDASKAMTDQPTHWKFENWGLEECAVTDVLSPPSGAPLLSTVGDLGGFYHEDLDKPPSGGMFQNPIMGWGSSIDVAWLKPELAVRVGKADKGIHGALSKDGGKTWSPFPTQLSKGWGGQVTIAADGSTIVWSPKDDLVQYSTDLGQTWKPAAGTPEVAKTPDWASVGFKVMSDRVNPKKCFAYHSKDGQAMLSEDGGATFKVVFDSLPTLADYENMKGNIQTVPGIEGDVWITSSKEVFRTKDSGKHWDPVDSVELGDAVAFGKAPEGKTYPAIYLSGTVAGKWGIYRSDDEAKTWIRINDDKHQFGGTTLLGGDPRIYGRVYVGTHGRGIVYADPAK